MNNFKYEYTDRSNIWSGKSWECEITDRKTDEQYNGYGKTSHLAKIAAEDSYWAERDNRSNRSNNYSRNSSSTNTPKTKFAERIPRALLYLLFIIIGASFMMYGYNNFGKDLLTSIVVIAGGILIFFASVVEFFKKLFDI